MNLDHLMTETITYAPFTGRDGDGKPTFSAQVTATARVEERTKRVRDADGKEVITSTQVATTAAIKTQDRVWLPGADTTKANEGRKPVAFSRASTLTPGYILQEISFA